jgi:hypothetical protein
MVIIAGQNIPEPTLEWESIHQQISLEGVSEAHWLEFAKLIGSQAHEELIKGFCNYQQGHPLEMATLIQAFVGKKEASK